MSWVRVRILRSEIPERGRVPLDRDAAPGEREPGAVDAVPLFEEVLCSLLAVEGGLAAGSAQEDLTLVGPNGCHARLNASAVGPLRLGFQWAEVDRR